MNNTDEEVDNEVTDEDTETEDSVPNRDKQKRIAELKAELSDLEGEGPVEDTVDGEAGEVSDAVEDEAEDIAKGPAKDEKEVEAEADDAAEEIAKAAKRQGVTFTDAEVDGIARRIVKRAREIEKEEPEVKSDEKTRERRTPDRRPRGTHFSERTMFGKGKK